MAETTRIGDYREGDAPEIARLFYETVRSVNRADYSDEQVEPAHFHFLRTGRALLD